jgi:hypothetical protein
VASNATLPAMVVAQVCGPPTSADDVRVTEFLTVTKTLRGVLQPPPTEVLDALVKSCGGGQHLAAFVLDELAKRLIDGPDQARRDAVRRLLALREAAEPAGDALLVALDTFVAMKAASSVQETCWALALAGAARQRALPRFVALLDGEFASAAMHGLDGMAEEAAEAIPSLEAFLSRGPGAIERQTAERLLKRIRHLTRR